MSVELFFFKQWASVALHQMWPNLRDCLLDWRRFHFGSLVQNSFNGTLGYAELLEFYLYTIVIKKAIRLLICLSMQPLRLRFSLIYRMVLFTLLLTYHWVTVTLTGCHNTWLKTPQRTPRSLSFTSWLIVGAGPLMQSFRLPMYELTVPNISTHNDYF